MSIENIEQGKYYVFQEDSSKEEGVCYIYYLDKTNPRSTMLVVTNNGFGSIVNSRILREFNQETDTSLADKKRKAESILEQVVKSREKLSKNQQPYDPEISHAQTAA